MIISYILMVLMSDSVVILWEVRCLSLIGMKGLKDYIQIVWSHFKIAVYFT